MLSAIAIIFAACTLIFRIRQSKRQFKINFFTDYTKRYQDIFTKLPLNVMSDEFDVSNIEKEKKEQHEIWVRAYFSLCSEELYVSSKLKLIDPEIWRLWEGGMSQAFRKPAFKNVWKKIKNDGYFDEDFSNFVEGKLK